MMLNSVEQNKLFKIHCTYFLCNKTFHLIRASHLIHDQNQFILNTTVNISTSTACGKCYAEERKVKT